MLDFLAISHSKYFGINTSNEPAETNLTKPDIGLGLPHKSGWNQCAQVCDLLSTACTCSDCWGRCHLLKQGSEQLVSDWRKRSTRFRCSTISYTRGGAQQYELVWAVLCRKLVWAPLGRYRYPPGWIIPSAVHFRWCLCNEIISIHKSREHNLFIIIMIRRIIGIRFSRWVDTRDCFQNAF